MRDTNDLAAVRASLTAARDSLGHVRMDRTALSIRATATRRRLRNRLAATGTGAAVLAVGLGLSLTAGHPASRPAQEGTVHASLAAWSVRTNADGTVTLTINEMFQQPEKLRQALVSAGVPAVVLVNKTCAGGDRYARDLDKIITSPDGRKPVWVIKPSAIPAGTELVLTESWDPRGFGAGGFALYRRGAALQCQTTYASQLVSPSAEASAQPTESASAVPSPR
jgi:hypothetical protein